MWIGSAAPFDPNCGPGKEGTQMTQIRLLSSSDAAWCCFGARGWLAAELRELIVRLFDSDELSAIGSVRVRCGAGDGALNQAQMDRWNSPSMG